METKNLDIYGSAPIPWTRARDALAASHGPAVTFFLGTVRADGTPHAAGVGAMWADETLWFVSGPGARKARNLAANNACTISARLAGIDVVVEGTAGRVTDADALERLASRYREAGWPAEVEDGAFTAPYSAPSAGPPPWHLYRTTIHTAFGVATEEPYGATRWRFNAEIARRGYEAVARGDLDAVGAFLDPEVTWHGGDPNAEGACRNRQEALAFMRQARDRGRVGELVEVIDAGDRVVVIMRPPASGGEPSDLAANVTTFRNGKAVEIVHYPSPDDALAAAGVAR